MKKISFLLLLCVNLFTSCENYPEEVNVTMDVSGSLSIKAVDNGNNPLEGAVIAYNYDVVLFEEIGETDAQGMFPMGEGKGGATRKLLITYEKGNLIYREYFMPQWLAGEDHVHVVNPFLNSGGIKIRLFLAGQAAHERKDLEVALLKKYEIEVEEIVKMTDLTTKVGDNDMAYFLDMPVGDYYVVVYNPKTNKKFGSDYPISISITRNKILVYDMDIL